MRLLRTGIGSIMSVSMLFMCKPHYVPAGVEAASFPADDEIVEDADGNIYTTVKIGNQTWLVENLRTTSYRSGRSIPRIEEDAKWSSTITGAYCHPAIALSAGTVDYGLLYNFYAVSDCGGLCPEGWHVPTAEEWRELIAFLGGNEIAGAKMKMMVRDAWNIRVDGTTNESGFSALPAGGRGKFGSAGEVGNYATWWSATRDDSLYAWHWGLHPNTHKIRANPGHVQSGFSVRCVKDRGDI